MIIVQLAGGLGNQMFQYATARRLARVRGVSLKLDLSAYGPDGDKQAEGLEAFRRHVRIQKFKIVAEQATPQEIISLRDPYTDNNRTVSRLVRQCRIFWPEFCWPRTHFNEHGYRFDPEVLGLQTPCYLSGFWQSEKYFSDIAETIRSELTPVDPAILENARRYAAELRKSGSAVVSLHVRRGETAVAQEKLKSSKGVWGPPTSIDYIERAIKEFSSNFKFLVFSDTAADIAWCKENIKADQLYFSEGHNDIEDMMLMSLCDHHIIASTFSWWAAWLGFRPGKRVVAPSQWGFPDAKFKMVTDDLIPPDWQMI